MIQELDLVKTDIKNAILSKNAEITGGMVTYADSIRSIVEWYQEKINISGHVKLGHSTFESIPPEIQFNTRDMSWMFAYCKNLAFVKDGELDTSGVTDMSYMFYNCTALYAVAALDGSSVVDMSSMFVGCDSIRSFSGLTDLGKNPALSVANFAALSNLTRTGVRVIFMRLYDRATAGYSVIPIHLAENVLALLSDEDIAIATNKGWTVR